MRRARDKGCLRMGWLRIRARLPAAGMLLVLASAAAAPLRAGIMDLLDPQIRVEGMGFIDNLRLRQNVRLLVDTRRGPGAGEAEGQAEPGEITFSGAFVADAVYLLAGEVRERGYRDVAIGVTAFRDGEAVYTGRWSGGSFAGSPPEELSADELLFGVEHGGRAYYRSLRVEGFPILDEEERLGYFYPAGGLFTGRDERYFTPGRLSGSVRALEQYARQEGYREAALTSREVSVAGDGLGRDVALTFELGPRFFVRELTVYLLSPDAASPGEAGADPPLAPEIGGGAIETTTEPPPAEAEHLETRKPAGTAFSRPWLLDTWRSLRTEWLRKGYPDAHVELAVTSLAREGATVRADLRAVIRPGPKVRVGEIRFAGSPGTHRGTLRRQIEAQPGGLLDRRQIRDGRSALSRLGAFERVTVEYDKVSPERWDVIYQLEPLDPNRLALIFGIGTFDVIRVGAAYTRRNLWGRAHRLRVEGIQSFRTTSAKAAYTVPQLFGEQIEGFAETGFLRREEVTFERLEYNTSFGVQTRIPEIDTQASLQYNFARLESRELEFDEPGDAERSTVASLELTLSRDETDNPLYPRAGWDAFGSVELAAPVLGGEVQYQRFDSALGWHHALDKDFIFHLGLRHGFVWSFEGSRTDVPINARFFPGGENSIRGYRRGEAASLNARGEEVGSAVYALAQLQLEVRLTGDWSLNLFSDNLGVAREIGQYPFDTNLHALGAGIAYNTPVGPIRVEYAHNLNPRGTDPDGTLHFSLGFPF